MNDKFFDVKKEKQDRIINASLKMFALNGYRHASTDDMVREAAISKGLLFHYFGSKLGLYVFCMTTVRGLCCWSFHGKLRLWIRISLCWRGKWRLRGCG